MKTKGLCLVVSVLAWAGPAGAAMDPNSALITVPCGVMDAVQNNGKPDADARVKCGDLHQGYHDAHPDDALSAEFYSGGQLFYTEENPQLFIQVGDGGSGLVTILVNGNGDSTQFNGPGNAAHFKTWYDAAATSIFEMPDITVKIRAHKDPKHPDKDLKLFQKYSPQGSALWCEHSADGGGGGGGGDVATETARAEAAEAAESNARIAADSTIAKTFVRLVGDDVIHGTKTFIDLVVGTITTAMNFTGPLSGDVTGIQSATFVVGLRGIPISGMHPVDGQALVYNGGLNQWEPRLLCQGLKLDCNNNPADGCETNIVRDPNCGGCGVVCPQAPNVSSFCDVGSCTAVCNPSFADCNGNPQDGCETNIFNNDPNNCGGCAVVCGGGAACFGGKCMAQCPNGQIACGPQGPCVDAQNDPGNCGQCGNRCQSGMCANGMCVGQCAAGQTLCNGMCIKTDFDINNCGGCARACVVPNGTPACMQGQCAVQQCNMGFRDCDNFPGDGCEIDTTSDPRNCGGCGFACQANAACINSQCVNQQGNCMDGMKDGNETDADCGGNCAACPVGKSCAVNHDCTSRVCAGGMCQASCMDGMRDGSETDVDCGGASCGPCGMGQGCFADADCQGGLRCQNNKCQ